MPNLHCRVHEAICSGDVDEAGEIALAVGVRIVNSIFVGVSLGSLWVDVRRVERTVLCAAVLGGDVVGCPGPRGVFPPPFLPLAIASGARSDRAWWV
jgi:hypothetical protein